MFAGIIAAGNGERLKSAGRGRLKPLLEVGGRPLIAWPVEALARAGAKSFFILSNTRGRELQPCLAGRFPHLRFQFLFKDTASSWESFRLVSRSLARRADDFVVSTADAVYPPGEAARFIGAASSLRPRGPACGPADAVLGVTSFVDDEKPLWAELSSDGRVVSLGDSVSIKRHACSGIYYVTRRLVEQMPGADRYAALREFWCWAVSAQTIGGVLMSKTVDVDRPEDIEAAENYIRDELCVMGYECKDPSPITPHPSRS